MIEITKKLAEFAANFRCEDLPAVALQRVELALADCLYCILAGVSSEPVRRLSAVLNNDGGAPEAAVLGTATRLPAASAALINGTAAHILDFDDINAAMLGHPSAPILPAVLALAEKLNASGREVVTAYSVGLEVAARLGRLVNPTHYTLGWHATITLGTIAATAAAGRLLRLDAGNLRTALGIAASHAGGVRANFGTDTKALHAGMAARAGVFSAQLAQVGISASQNALDGPRGYLAMIAGNPQNGADWPDIFNRGAEFELMRSGLTIKRHACCGTAHTAIDALLESLTQHGITKDAVESVECKVNSIAPSILTYESAATPLEAKFSMPYCLAVTLADQACGLPQFEPARVRDDGVQKLMRRISMTVDEHLPTDVGGLTPAVVTVHLKSGLSHTRRVDQPKGSPSRPLERAELQAKLISCASLALSDARVRELLELLPHVDALPSVDRLISALCPLQEASP